MSEAEVPFSLRVITDADIDAVQAVYDARPDAFRLLIGRPALRDQAAVDFVEGLRAPGRYQFGVDAGGRLVGVADLKLDDETVGTAHMGLLLLAPPYHDPDIAGLVLHILERWLARDFAVTELQTGVVAADAGGLAFWQDQGYRFTGEQYRRELPDYAPRFLVLRKKLE